MEYLQIYLFPLWPNNITITLKLEFVREYLTYKNIKELLTKISIVTRYFSILFVGGKISGTSLKAAGARALDRR